MLSVKIEEDRVCVGERFVVSFQRTLRIPDDGRDYPLPPGLGEFPLHRFAEYAGRVPETWRGDNGVFIPIYQREALWIAFHAAEWKPNAVKVRVGGVNAVSGAVWDEALTADPQNYVVCPVQPWLDGINVGGGLIRQFVAMPLGAGYTIEAQITGKETFGGIQVVVYDPKPGRFPDQPTPKPARGAKNDEALFEQVQQAEMGVAAGGSIRQKIYPDPYGVDTWCTRDFGEIHVRLLNSEQYTAVTDREAPPSPINPKLYVALGMPWFELYDENLDTIAGSAVLRHVQSRAGVDKSRDEPADPNDQSLDLDQVKVTKIGLKKVRKRR